MTNFCFSRAWASGDIENTYRGEDGHPYMAEEWGHRLSETGKPRKSYNEVLEQTDEDIAREVRKGYGEAFGLLVLRYQPKLARYARSSCFGAITSRISCRMFS